MTEGNRTYLLDTNVFIEAHRRYYAFDICPGFWDWLLHQQEVSRAVSIDRVRGELATGDTLEEWLKATAPPALFRSTRDPSVVSSFAAMMAWVQGNPQFLTVAKAEFAQVADGWLAAYPEARG